MHSRVKRIVLSTLVLVCCCGGLASVPQEQSHSRSTLHIRVVGAITGSPVTHNISLSVTGPSRTESYPCKGDTVRVRLHPGKYVLQLKGPGIVSHPMKITMAEADRWVTFPFELDKPISRVPKAGPTIEGRLNIADDSTWLKLVAIFGNAQQETQSDSAGRFVFERVAAGYYLLIATRPGGEPAVERVRVTDEYRQIVVDVSVPAVSPKIPITGRRP
jgi:hypothetical protein